MNIWNLFKRTRAEEIVPDTSKMIAPPKPTPPMMDLVAVEKAHPTVRPASYRTPDDILDGQIQASSITRFFGDTFNPYSYSTFRDLFAFSEPSFYKDYQETYTQNPFSHMVVEYLMNECFANDYHFEGPGAKVVEDFFTEDNTRYKIKMGWREAVKKGNGFMDVGSKRGTAERTRVLSTDDIQVEFDQKTGEKVYKQGSIQLKSEYIIHLTILDEVGNPYGISLLRSNLLFLTALMDVGGDIMSALKRIAYAPIVARLDFDGVSDTDRKTVMDLWKGRLKEMESATQNFVMDKKHELTLLGQGAAGAKLLPTNDMIEPILSVVLMNFGIPIGIFLQTGANKAIIDEQRKAMQRFYEDLRTKIKFYVETRIIPHITGRETKLVFNRPPLSTEQTQAEFQTLIAAYQGGVLSREYILEHMDIEDKGKTFFTPLKDANKSATDETETGDKDATEE